MNNDKPKPNTNLRRFAQIASGNPLSALPAAGNLLAGQVGLNTLNNAVNTAQQAVETGEFGLPKPLAAGRAMGPLHLEMQSLYDLGDQYGLSRDETKSYSDMLLQNGLLIPEQSELFSALKNISPTLGGNFRDVLDIATRVAIQYRAGTSQNKVKKILDVLTELSKEYAQNPSFNIVAMFANASRGNMESLPILSWMGAVTSSVKNGRDLGEYYSKINGLNASIFAPAHDKLAIENKKAMYAEELKRQDYFLEESAQKMAWEKIYQPNFEMLTKIYRDWARNPEEAFNILGIDGWNAVKALSSTILMAGAKVGVFTKVLGMNTRSPEVSARGSSNHSYMREVFADARKDARQEEQGLMEDYNTDSAKNAPKIDTQPAKTTSPYLQPNTVQMNAQTDSVGQSNDAWSKMVAYNKALAPLHQRFLALEKNLQLLSSPENGFQYKSIMANLKPLEAAMVAESGMKVGGGSNELSQVTSTTLLTPEIIKDTVATCGQAIEDTLVQIQDYIGTIQQFYEIVKSISPTTAEQKADVNGFFSEFNIAKNVISGNIKSLQTTLEKAKQALVDYHTVLPTLVKVTRLENQISLFENLSTQIKSMTGNDFVRQFGTVTYNTTAPDGSKKLVSGPAPSQALIVLYMRVIAEFRNALKVIQDVINSGQMSEGLTNALIQRRKQIVSKIEGIKAKYTQIISASLGSAAGGAPASMERQVRLTSTNLNERVEYAEEQEADRIADEVIRKYFDDLLPGYGTILDNPEKHRKETVKEVKRHKAKHKSPKKRCE